MSSFKITNFTYRLPDWTRDHPNSPGFAALKDALMEIDDLDASSTPSSLLVHVADSMDETHWPITRQLLKVKIFGVLFQQVEGSRLAADVNVQLVGVSVEMPAAAAQLDSEAQEALARAFTAVPGVSGVDFDRVANLVHLDGRFDQLPAVLQELESVAAPYLQPGRGPTVHLPFMLTREGGSIEICDGETGEKLPDDWTGVCTGTNTHAKYWVIGRAEGERSFGVLKATRVSDALWEGSMRLQQERQAPNPSTFEFLEWVQRCAMFPGDLQEELKAHGLDPADARYICTGDAVKKGNLLQLHADHLRFHPDVADKFVAQYWDTWIGIQKDQVQRMAHGLQSAVKASLGDHRYAELCDTVDRGHADTAAVVGEYVGADVLPTIFKQVAGHQFSEQSEPDQYLMQRAVATAAATFSRDARSAPPAPDGPSR